MSKQELKLIINEMRNNNGFSVIGLQRKFSPYYRFTILKCRFWMRSRTTGVSLSVTFEHFKTFHYITVTTSRNPLFSYSFFVLSNKHFMLKLLKHELI